MRFRAEGFLLAALLLGAARWIPDAELPAPWTTPPPDVPSAEEMLLDADSRLLAEVILGEDPRARAAVSWVVLNRARDTGASVLEVVYARQQFQGYRPRPWSPALRRAQDRAREVLLGRVTDPTQGARYFHRVGSPTPAWAPPRARWSRHGDHWFYARK